VKADERALLEACIAGARANGGRNGFHPADPCAREIGASLGIHEKRVHYLLDKWTWWDCGVSVGTGWFSDITAAEAALLEEQK